jgi:hypothetical protein
MRFNAIRASLRLLVAGIPEIAPNFWKFLSGSSKQFQVPRIGRTPITDFSVFIIVIVVD